MDFKKLFRKDNKAVSPVIGVILMVAITVILAAAIGSSVFGKGTTESAPQANFNIKAVNTTDPGYIKLEHLGGDPIHFEDASVTKVTASLNGSASVALDATGLGTFDVGSVKTLALSKSGGGKAFDPIPKTSETVNIKVIDVQTNQLICDKDVRF